VRRQIAFGESREGKDETVTETVFHNVTITIMSDSPKEAYALLCSTLGSLEREKGIEIDWTTDTFSTQDNAEERSTSALYPIAADVLP
jgi:hypothetical protein